MSYPEAAEVLVLQYLKRESCPLVKNKINKFKKYRKVL